MKKIIVSGCARGLGLALAERFLERGDKVFGFSRRKTEQIAALEKLYPETLKFTEKDLSDKLQIQGIASEAENFLGGIDCLINNAATASDGVLAMLSDDKIESMLDVNLRATILLTKYAAREMILRGGGCILNISSIVSLRGYSGLSVYSATKGALDAFTRSMARELGKRQIRVNSICPGFMHTEMSNSLTEKQRDSIIRRTPLGRFADLDDICNLAEFLCSDMAKSITGQSIVVDGGLTC